MYQKYQKELEIVKRQTFYKYFLIPLELDDLESLKYWSILESARNYNMRVKKKLKDYIFQRYVWDIHKHIRKLLSAKHKVLNYCANYQAQEGFDVASPDNFVQDLLDQEEKERLIMAIKARLSVLETEIFNLWLADYSITKISQILELNYRQVDNAMQRIIRKVKQISKNC
ncbi:hypothetical protein [Spiroplasma chrysopicola]|uniref:Uncharacterized protein n=1 Tax=Spiroplasma chrysopicola DF-1 TaxID=1276227 RepID=R4UF41_9MOLU|nr:hypothetical protein [Spiroplasma chrysopicola]AGM24735.1 hypothetical protein SCHRY_v1c01500 [Spiroplasma chrysopicola DF-1]